MSSLLAYFLVLRRETLRLGGGACRGWCLRQSNTFREVGLEGKDVWDPTDIETEACGGVREG